MRNSGTNKLHTCKTFRPFVLAQSALRMVILGIVYNHKIVFTQLMTSNNVFCGIQ